MQYTVPGLRAGQYAPRQGIHASLNHNGEMPASHRQNRTCSHAPERQNPWAKSGDKQGSGQSPLETGCKPILATRQPPRPGIVSHPRTRWSGRDQGRGHLSCRLQPKPVGGRGGVEPGECPLLITPQQGNAREGPRNPQGRVVSRPSSTSTPTPAPKSGHSHPQAPLPLDPRAPSPPTLLLTFDPPGNPRAEGLPPLHSNLRSLPVQSACAPPTGSCSSSPNPRAYISQEPPRLWKARADNPQ